MNARSRGGAVLVFVVLLMLALVGLGHAMLVGALSEAGASRAAARHLAIRAAAEAAVSAVLRAPGGSWIDSVPPGGTRAVVSLSLGRPAATGSARRLAAEAWLIEGEGWIPGGGSEHAARLAWTLDPLTRVLALRGAITAPPGATVVPAGTVDASAPETAEPPLPGSVCDPWRGALAALYAHAPLATVAGPDHVADSANAPHLGLLGFGVLSANATLADLVPVPSGAPAAVERLGACVVNEPWNWGDPQHPGRPCGAYLPLRVARGDLTVTGGAGQGTLLVDGDLTLATGVRYHGLVIVRGRLRIEDGATLEGLALAGRGTDIAPSARVRASACWAVRALDSARASLGRLVPVPGVGALGPF